MIPKLRKWLLWCCGRRLKVNCKHMRWQNSAHVDWGQAEGLACADLGARTPIVWTDIFDIFLFSFSHRNYSPREFFLGWQSLKVDCFLALPSRLVTTSRYLRIKLSKPRLSQQLCSTESEVRLHSYRDPPTTHRNSLCSSRPAPPSGVSLRGELLPGTGLLSD